jgi:RNA polymerase sigma-70 factor (ECF subfamily)
MDERLLIEAARRDPSRFAALYDEHFERVYAFVVRRVHDRPDAEDLTAEVFRHALAALKDFEWSGAPFAAWLFRIAANEVADHFKKRGREQTAARAAEPDAGEIESIEHRATLYRAVDRLPADQKRVIVMRFVEGRSTREIAADFARSEGAIKQLQWRALQTLRAQLTHG